MTQENELVTILIGIGLFIFIIFNFSKLKTLPAIKILLAGLSVLLIGWILTILEGFFLEDLLNLLEHTCYALSSIIMAVWFWVAFKQKEGD
jgi:hypothetical protein